MLMTLTMPWPSLKPLSPNWRGHWSGRARARRKFREAWFWTALEQRARPLVGVERLTVSLIFYPPDKRARDIDNLLGSCKAGLDGLADVLKVDDSKWAIKIEMGDTVGGFVRVEVDHAA